MTNQQNNPSEASAAMSRPRSRIARAPTNQPSTSSVANATPAARARSRTPATHAVSHQPFSASIANVTPAAITCPQTPAIHDTSNQPFSASVANAAATVVSRPQDRPPQAPVQQPFLAVVTNATPTARAHPQTTATHATSSQPFSASIANATPTIVSRPQARSSQAPTNRPSLASVANATATTIRLRPESPQAPINEPFRADATPTAVSRPRLSTTHASLAPQAPARESHGLCDQRRHLRLHTCGCAYITPLICTLPESVSPHYHPAAPLRILGERKPYPCGTCAPLALWANLSAREELLESNIQYMVHNRHSEEDLAAVKSAWGHEEAKRKRDVEEAMARAPRREERMMAQGWSNVLMWRLEMGGEIEWADEERGLLEKRSRLGEGGRRGGRRGMAGRSGLRREVKA